MLTAGRLWMVMAWQLWLAEQTTSSRVSGDSEVLLETSVFWQDCSAEQRMVLRPDWTRMVLEAQFVDWSHWVTIDVTSNTRIGMVHVKA